LKVQAGIPSFPQYAAGFGGHALPNWDFPIRENPQSGNIAGCSFAWKALSPENQRHALLIGKAFPSGGVNMVTGDYNWGQGVLVEKRVAGAPPIGVENRAR